MFLYGLWLKSYLLGWDFQCLSRAFLNVSTSLAFINSSGSSFHIVAILSVKKYLPRFSLLPLSKIFLLWPLVLVVPLGNFGATSSSYVPDSILKVSIMSPRSRRNVSVGSPSSCNLSSYSSRLKPGSCLVALLWTDSISSISFYRCGTQAEIVNSRCGQTRLL